MHDVICLGSATMDVFVETEKNTAITQEIDGKSTQFITYRSGEKILISELHYEVGGGGTNTAVCFAKLGLKTAYVGNIGNDTNGDLVMEKLTEEHVEFLGTRIGKLTNYSIILDSTLLKDRTILVYKDASEHLRYEHLPPMQTHWVYVSSLSGESFETAKRLITEFRAADGKVACNPSNYQIEHDRQAVLAMLRYATVAIMNNDEARLLVGEESEEETLKRIHALGPSIIAVTLGSKGVIASDGTTMFNAPATPGLKVKETTGAGDCFAATFTAGLMIGKQVDEALRWGLVNVENHIQYVGAKAGLFTRLQLEASVAADTRVIDTKKI